MATPQFQIGNGRTTLIVATSVVLSFISFWRAAAIVLNDPGSSAFHVGGIAEQAVGRSARRFILESCCSLALSVRSSSNHVRGLLVAEFIGWSSVVTLCLGLLLMAPVELRAQQTIFNVPTTDVLDRGKVYGELDVPFKISNDQANVVPRFSSFVPRIVVGTGNHFEVGLNLTGNTNPGPDSATLIPTIKYKAYDGRDNGWVIVLGDNLFIPVRNQSYDFGNYFYAEASKTFKTKTRVTFGGYHFTANVVAIGAQRSGGQFGFEHPITTKINLAADWYTGKHASGYLTPGIIFKPHSQVTGYAGYSLGNSNLSNGNHFFLVELGYNFN